MNRARARWAIAAAVSLAGVCVLVFLSYPAAPSLHPEDPLSTQQLADIEQILDFQLPPEMHLLKAFLIGHERVGGYHLYVRAELPSRCAEAFLGQEFVKKSQVPEENLDSDLTPPADADPGWFDAAPLQATDKVLSRYGDRDFLIVVRQRNENTTIYVCRKCSRNISWWPSGLQQTLHKYSSKRFQWTIGPDGPPITGGRTWP